MSIDKLVEEVQRLRREFAEVSESVLDRARREGGEAASRLREAAEDGWGEARDTVQGVFRHIDDQPLASTAVAFLIGMLLGALFLGRRRR